MNNHQIQQIVLTAIVKSQSVLHDLDLLPLHSDFTKQLKFETSKMLAYNLNYLQRLEKLLNKTTDLMDMESAQSYIELVTKFDQLGKNIDFSDWIQK